MVEGINLITYDKAGDDLTKNDYFQALLETARERGFVPACVVFDSWYGSLANLKRIHRLGLDLADPAEGQPPGESGPERPAPGGTGGGPVPTAPSCL